MSHQHLHTVAPTHQHTPAAFPPTPTPALTGPEPSPNTGTWQGHGQPRLAQLHPAGTALQQGRKPSPVHGHAGEARAQRGGAQGKEDSVKHSVSQSSGAGGTGRYPWWGEKTIHAMQNVGETNREPSGLRSGGRDVTFPLAANMKQSPNCYKLVIRRRSLSPKVTLHPSREAAQLTANGGGIPSPSRSLRGPIRS